MKHQQASGLILVKREASQGMHSGNMMSNIIHLSDTVNWYKQIKYEAEYGQSKTA